MKSWFSVEISILPSSDKKEALAKPVLLFWASRRAASLRPFDFICPGGMNPPGIKVLPRAKRLYGAKAPPRPAGPHLPHEALALPVLLFRASRRAAALRPFDFICPGGMNPPGIKGLPETFLWGMSFFFIRRGG